MTKLSISNSTYKFRVEKTNISIVSEKILFQIIYTFRSIKSRISLNKRKFTMTFFSHAHIFFRFDALWPRVFSK